MCDRITLEEAKTIARQQRMLDDLDYYVIVDSDGEYIVADEDMLTVRDRPESQIAFIAYSDGEETSYEMEVDKT